MHSLEKDTKNRDLGMKKHTCRICGTQGEFQSYLVREMMQGTKEEFEYFVCGNCNCLQIAEVPEDLGKYYGENYYSFSLEEQADYQYEKPVECTYKMLDVGCGSGAWLLGKAQEGCGNLYGCDPFLQRDLHFGDRVHIRNCSIHEMEGDGTFDGIHMGDSFEHVTDPLEVLQSARRLLAPDGRLLMTIPTYPNIAMELFGTHWYQLDAPRHIFLHSLKSLEILGKKSGMKILDVQYDSNNSQFIRSFFYQHGVPFSEITSSLIREYFTFEQYNKMKQTAEEMNQKGYGDHMTVIWIKDED